MPDVSHGMDPAAIEALGRRLQDHYAARVEEVATQLNSLVAQTSTQWVGPKGEMFRSWWPAKRSKLIAIAQDLHGFGQSALNNVSEQRQASTAGVVPTSPSGAGTGPHSDRLDGAAAQAHVLDREAGYLERAGARQFFPGTFGRADAWLAELRAGNPSPAQVAAFESYMATLKAAVMQQAIVEDAARHAWNEFVEAAKSGASAVAGGAQIADDVPTSLAEHAFEAAMGYTSDQIGSAFADGAHVGDIGAASILIQYRLDADATLQQLEGRFRGLEGVQYSDPGEIRTVHYEAYRSDADVAIQKAEFAEALTPITGDGGILDTGLRTGLKVLGGPLTARALDGLEIVGSTAQASFHIESGSAALIVAASGVDHLHELAYAYGVR